MNDDEKWWPYSILLCRGCDQEGIMYFLRRRDRDAMIQAVEAQGYKALLFDRGKAVQTKGGLLPQK